MGKQLILVEMYRVFPPRFASFRLLTKSYFQQSTNVYFSYILNMSKNHGFFFSIFYKTKETVLKCCVTKLRDQFFGERAWLLRMLYKGRLA